MVQEVEAEGQERIRAELQRLQALDEGQRQVRESSGGEDTPACTSARLTSAPAILFDN